MSRVFVCGLGAVSPAGWDVPALRNALQHGEPLPPQKLEHPGWVMPLQARHVPNQTPRPAFFSNPRLRRASPIAHYAVAATLDATQKAKGRVGVIACFQSGCVQYSHRFFEETLQDPSTASPLLFPETVFAAPASHIATLIAGTPSATTIVGDPAAYLQGMALGVQWLEDNTVDACVVIGAEELSWLLGDALRLFDSAAILGCGAGAVCLTLDPALSIGVELAGITDAHSYTKQQNRTRAANAMRRQLPSSAQDLMLFDGISGERRLDGPENAAWRDWSGPRLSAKKILGEGFMAAGAWQCVAACDAVAQNRCSSALVSLVGCNQHAIGAQFSKCEPTI